MTDLLSNVALGLETALSFQNLAFCLFGVTLGTVIGIIPGIGALAAISLLLPLTYHLDPTTALVMLAGIFYGTTYGGSTSSILMNVPGTPVNAVVCLDGYPMAQQGRAGVALFMTTIASFFGGSVGIVIMMLFSPLIVDIALDFGPTEYFSLILLGLVSASTLSSGSTVKGIAMVGLGIVLGLVGLDIYTGVPRYVFGWVELYDGISLVALAMGLFGVPEVIASIRTSRNNKVDPNISLRSMLPSRDDLRRSWMAMARGSGIGSFFGILPGVGGTVASFLAYAVEKKLSRDPSRFGQGAIEGIASPEATNNAADQTAFIPTLTLGIPGSPSMAIILGVLLIHGITPGPTMIAEKPDMFWGLIMSFWIGNIMLLVLNIPLIGLWVRILTVPYHVLFPAIIVFVCIGTFSVNSSAFDVGMVLMFGMVGYVMRVLEFPAAPLLLGFVLGPMLEENFLRAMTLSSGSFVVFVTHPISLVFLLAALAVLVTSMMGWMAGAKARRRRAAEDE